MLYTLELPSKIVRVHWSCAGLRIEDDPIDEWLCPDCVERLDSGELFPSPDGLISGGNDSSSGAHRDDIEQAPLDRCIRGTCILRSVERRPLPPSLALSSCRRLRVHRQKQAIIKMEDDEMQYQVEKIVGYAATPFPVTCTQEETDVGHIGGELSLVTQIMLGYSNTW